MTSGLTEPSEKSQLVVGQFSEKDLRHFRRIAFLAVALSTITMLACVIVMPISYQFIQRIQSTVTNDIEFCRSRNRGLWTEVVAVQRGKGQHEHVERLKRSTSSSGSGRWLFGHFVEEQGAAPTEHMLNLCARFEDSQPTHMDPPIKALQEDPPPAREETVVLLAK